MTIGIRRSWASLRHSVSLRFIWQIPADSVDNLQNHAEATISNQLITSCCCFLYGNRLSCVWHEQRGEGLHRWRRNARTVLVFILNLWFRCNDKFTVPIGVPTTGKGK